MTDAIGGPMCPQCKGTMRAHCPGWRCRWAFCGKCDLRMDTKTGRTVGRAFDTGT